LGRQIENLVKIWSLCARILPLIFRAATFFVASSCAVLRAEPFASSSKIQQEIAKYEIMKNTSKHKENVLGSSFLVSPFKLSQSSSSAVLFFFTFSMVVDTLDFFAMAASTSLSSLAR
jgi:hypothetical protein